ncbi:MAG: glutamate--cysteine ligase [Clostridiales bacterium]|nr:glutamate--cysteine ligase [Clostridiales bacterium]
MTDQKEKNRKKIAGFFETGSKKDSGCDRIGLELEHFIVDKDTGKSVFYYGEKGIETILKALSARYEEEIISDAYLIGLKKNDCTVTLEPGAQLELSIAPAKSLKNIMDIQRGFIEDLSVLTDPLGYKIVCLGYREKDKAEEIPLIPKNRYRNMDAHFKKTGTMGRNMMRGTGASQVSIDYRDEEDFKKKFRAACFISPLFALVADNAPFFEGETYKKHTLRQRIWQNVDDARAGIPWVIDEPDFGFLRYAEYISKVPLIVHGDYDDSYTTKTVDEIYSEREIKNNEIAHAASMVFPDVRLVRYIEIRVGDSMPIDMSISYAAMIKGLFLNEKWLDIQEDRFAGFCTADIKKAKKEIEEKGYEAEVYGIPICEILDEMVCHMSIKLPRDEKHYTDIMSDMINKRQNPAMIKIKKEKNQIAYKR